VLCALQIESGGTIEIKDSHAMQNCPEFVQHCIIIGREGAFHDEPSLEGFSRPEAALAMLATSLCRRTKKPRSSDC
jgi:hypothetical protein